MASCISFASASLLVVVYLFNPASAFAALSPQALTPYAEGLDAMNEGAGRMPARPSRARSRSANDGSISRGKMDVQTGRDPVRGRPEPSRGQMMLYDETSGQIGTMWYEFTERDVMEITEMDSTKYVTRRER